MNLCHQETVQNFIENHWSRCRTHTEHSAKSLQVNTECWGSERERWLHIPNTYSGAWTSHHIASDGSLGLEFGDPVCTGILLPTERWLDLNYKPGKERQKDYWVWEMKNTARQSLGSEGCLAVHLTWEMEFDGSLMRDGLLKHLAVIHI